MRRQLLAITLGLGLTIGSVGPTFAQQESRRFTANGTILTIVDGQADFITADITGRTTVVRLDLSQLRDLKGRRVANLKNNESIQIVLQEKPDGRFMAIEYAELAKGSKVNNTDWGVREEYTTRDDSIEARVDNVPDDDEAIAKDHELDNKGRRIKKDDD